MVDYETIKNEVKQFSKQSFPESTVVDWAMQKGYDLDLVFKAMYENDVKITPTNAVEYFLFGIYMEMRKLNNRDF